MTAETITEEVSAEEEHAVPLVLAALIGAASSGYRKCPLAVHGMLDAAQAWLVEIAEDNAGPDTDALREDLESAFLRRDIGES